jgi:hypothetical protein
MSPAPAWRAPPVPVPVDPPKPPEPVDSDAGQEAPSADQPEQAPAAEAADQPPTEQVEPGNSEPPAAEAADASPPVDEQHAAPSSEAEAEAKPNRQSRGMELMIDSLPHHTLSEPIPVTLNPIGDGVFTATVHDLNISGTGGTIAEALLVLKEQIESLHDDLSKQSQLDSDQKATLKGLRAYIQKSR